MTPARAWDLFKSGNLTIVDVRAPSEFAQGHPQWALNLPYSAKGLQNRLSLIVGSNVPVAIFTHHKAEGSGALSQLKTGNFHVLGVIDCGIEQWSEMGLPVGRLEELSLQELCAPRHSPATIVLDVREDLEWEMGHIPGALLVSLGSLTEHLDDIPRDACIAVICEAGIRSSTAASLLLACGFSTVANVPVGTAGYRNAGLPLAIPTVPVGTE